MEIICQDCGKVFIFTEGEQKFYAEKNLATPKRCKECREKRKIKFLGGDTNGHN